MKIAIGQINTKIGDFEGNVNKIIHTAERAAEDLAELLVMPEMCVCGYPPMDLLDYDLFVRENQKALRRLQRELPSQVAVAVGYVDRTRGTSGKPLQNVVSILYEGKILHTQAKTLLPTYDVFDEARYFEPATERRVCVLKGKRVGIAICEDIWWEQEPVPGTRYTVDPVKELMDAGAEILLSPSASPFFTGKQEVRRGLLEKIGHSSGVPTVYVNMVGGNDNLIFDGCSMITDSSGQVIKCAEEFAEDYLVCDTEAQHQRTALPRVDESEKLRKALVMGVRDYVYKCGFKRVHLGLSGGIDSALVAVIAKQALGPENVHCFALPSRYSSEASETDARQLADNLGIGYDILPIEEPFKSILAVLAPVFEGREPDVAEENVQARIRGLLLMAYSNKFGSLLLTTGNKSELATGYCTLYGDMSGGLAVIGDLFKGQVYNLCNHVNSAEELIPQNIIDKPPSAELRPDQTDQDSLPSYEVLDDILAQYLLENKSAAEIAQTGHDLETVREVLRLVGRNEYKRRQAPPVLKVSTRAFGTGRRMPIARNIYEA
ncbi:MAG: NAD+ synthase [Spirochaetaceae bacterium]|nr:NAD+ synthase [Spirochaetaceae bacterium]MCF7951518.1 NAD+ synthase [Spirochaetaceae bacterium]